VLSENLSDIENIQLTSVEGVFTALELLCTGDSAVFESFALSCL
jgi:hypothetical protein